MSPTFSVVIPCYNRASSILPTLSSVQSQTCGDFECIVVDDGSSDADRLAEVVDSMDDARFRMIRRENGGGGAARNTGVEAACGRFIAFLDSDDFFLPRKLESFLSVIEDRVDKAWYSQTLVSRGVARQWPRPSRAMRPGEDMGEYLFVQNEFIQTSTLVLARSLALRVPFDPALRKGQDLDLCLRLHSAGVSFVMLKAPMAVWVDQTEVGRTSRVGGYHAPLEWLERSRSHLSTSAELGYRATVLAYYMAADRPLVALRDLFVGWYAAGVPGRVVIRQLLRCFVPRRLYRSMVNAFVAVRGQSPSSEPSE